jgi:hypothetical protein
VIRSSAIGRPGLGETLPIATPRSAAETWGNFPTRGRVNLGIFRPDEREMAEMRGFPQFGTPPAIDLASAERAAGTFEGVTQMQFSSFARHALAVVGAVFISGLLMVNSLAVQAHEVHSVVGILA